MSGADQYIKDLIELHESLHKQLRTAISDLDSVALDWTPGPDTSSIGTIITHALGAEAEMLRNILQIPTNRDRPAEFALQTHTREELSKLLDSADEDWRVLAPRLQEADLQTLRPRPNKPVPQSGLFWLVRNYGHMREHLAQVEFTKQLYQTTGR